jgi:excisionase family DNA binding protein
MGMLMNAIPHTKQVEAAPLLVPAKHIARRLSVSSRYVHILAETGKIPVCRFGKNCIRFNEAAVLAALGIPAEAIAGSVK